MKKLIILLYIGFALVLSTCSPAPTPSTPNVDSLFTVAPEFEPFYNQYGGLQTLGIPISADVEEDGIRVQYFQNGRLEYHPQLPDGSQVILSDLGKEHYGIAPCLSPENVEPQALYFDATCHSVSPQFREFFVTHGGVNFFGYPISEMYIEDGRFVQNFERATLVWDKSKLPGLKYGLSGLGSAVCPKATCGEDAPKSFFPEFSTTDKKLKVVNAIYQFYDTHRGQILFGSRVGEQRTGEDGAVEQVFENAILYENPSSFEGISLRPLGLKVPGALEPAAPQVNTPTSFYSTKYGHNVIGTFYEFFNANGGVETFGHPISEARVESGYLVQYFENAAISWRSGFSTDKASRLLNLGQQSLPQGPLGSITPTRPNPPKMLSLTNEALFVVYEVESGKPQTLKAQVRDENGAPVSGANVVFTIKTPGGDQQYASVTNAEGIASASFTLTLGAYKINEYLNYGIRVNYGNLSSSKNDSFLPWGKP